MDIVKSISKKNFRRDPSGNSVYFFAFLSTIIVVIPSVATNFVKVQIQKDSSHCMSVLSEVFLQTSALFILQLGNPWPERKGLCGLRKEVSVNRFNVTWCLNEWTSLFIIRSGQLIWHNLAFVQIVKLFWKEFMYCLLSFFFLWKIEMMGKVRNKKVNSPHISAKVEGYGQIFSIFVWT